MARLRLFVAVTPTADLLHRIAALARPPLAGLRWTTREQWHVTLRFLGGVEEADVADLVAALGTVRVPPVSATIGPEVARFGQRVLHVPVRGLDDLAAAVSAASASFGEPPDDRPFSGHLTLARVRRGAGRVDLRPRCDPHALPGAAWDVDAFTLYRSDLHPKGARYSIVRSFPLGGAGTRSA